MKYTSVVCGGTFDRLHTGHHALLQKAFSVGGHVTIGLTTDEYVNNIKNSCKTGSRSARQISNIKYTNEISKREKQIFPYTKRKHNLESWLNSQGWEGRYTIVPLEDPYGPTINSDTNFDAIVVSSETRKTAEEINAIRTQRGLKELAIVEIPMVPAEDLHTVSSTRVRKGEIDTKGRLILPDALRPELRKSIGQVIPEREIANVLKQDAEHILISVGDMTTKKILDVGIQPNLAIIDFQVERKPYLWEKEAFDRLVVKSNVLTLQSGPGYISSVAMQVIQDTFKGTSFKGVYSNQLCTVLLVDGEEDLLVLPVLIEAPIGSLVYYGQPRLDQNQPARNASHSDAGGPNEGIIRVVVTEAKKRMAKILLQQFIQAN